MNITVIDREGQAHDVTGAAGGSVMDAIRNAGLPIAAQCGGCCSCATCHVHVDETWTERLPPRSEDEDALLELVEDVRPTSRLSCQITLSPELNGVKVALAPGSEL
jgi:2Fe-2S ferredoxin